MFNKDDVYNLLENNEFKSLLNLFDQDKSKLRKYVTMASYHHERNLHGQAIEFMHYLSVCRGRLYPEFFREMIRRHIWGMNDEGGNVDWSAPEIIGGIIAGQPELFGEFGTIMIAAAIDEPFFQQSMFRAIKIIGPENKRLIEYYLPRLREFENSDNRELAQLAAETLRDIFAATGLIKQ